jgi:hypothetical protein
LNHPAAHHIAQSYRSAGIEPAEWRPELGYRANRPLLHRLYEYYQALYFKNPAAFLWAGLARLTGGQVLYGMENLCRIAKDPCALTQGIMAVAKDIFEGIAWQHELYLSDREALLQLCAQLDAQRPAVHPYVRCWQLMADGSPANVALGNRLLLQNEQQSTIQPHYDAIKKDRYSARFFWFTRFTMRNIHPYHRRFFFCHPFGDVTVAADRWRWISRSMWPSWCALPEAERSRLVALGNGAVVRQDWRGELRVES